MKNSFKIIKPLAALFVLLALCALPVKAQPLPGGPAPAINSVGGYLTVSNVVPYVNATNAVVYVTNVVAGLTNLIVGANTATALYSTWWNPTGTNGSFIGATNAIIIPLSARYLTLQIEGSNLSNGIANVGPMLITNTLTFAGSFYTAPTAAQIETVPQWKYAFTSTNGAFVYATNIECDALGSLSLVSWTQGCTNTAYGVTNPVIRWRTK